MPRVLVCFIYWIICVIRDRLRIVLECAPKIRYHAIQVVHGFDAGRMRPSQEHRATSEERLNEIRHISEAVPYDIRNA